MAIGTPAKAGSLTGTTQVTSATLTTTASIPAGALILVSVSRQNVNAISGLTSVTDSAGNTYVSAVGNGDGGQNQYTELWYCKNAAALASGGTVTVNGLNLLASGPSWGFSVWYDTGLDNTTPLDKTNGANSNASPWATTAQTTTSASELLWVVYGGNQNEPAAITNAQSLPASGWTSDDAITYGGNSGNSLRTAHNIVSATGSYKGGGTQTVGNAGAFVFASFIAASGGGTVTGSANVGTNGAGLLVNATVVVVGDTGAGLTATSNTENSATPGNAGGGLNQGILLGDDWLTAASSGLNQGMLTGTLGGGVQAVSFAVAGSFALGTGGGGLSASSVALVGIVDLGSNAGSGILSFPTTIVLGTNGAGLQAGSLALAGSFDLGSAGGGLSASSAALVSVVAVGSNTGSGILSFPTSVTLGNGGAGLSFSPTVVSGIVTMGGAGGIFFFGITDMGNAGAGLSIPNAFVGDLNGKWVNVLVWIWRPPGQWDALQVNRWVPNGSGGGMWKLLST